MSAAAAAAQTSAKTILSWAWPQLSRVLKRAKFPRSNRGLYSTERLIISQTARVEILWKHWTELLLSWHRVERWHETLLTVHGIDLVTYKKTEFSKRVLITIFFQILRSGWDAASQQQLISEGAKTAPPLNLRRKQLPFMPARPGNLFKQGCRTIGKNNPSPSFHQLY